MAGYVVNHILGGGGMSSRLYREVREKRGLAYSVNQSLLWMDRSAIFIGSTGTRADRAGETVDAVNKEIRRMAEEGPTQQELDEAKSYLKGSQMLSLDTSSKLASALLQYQLDKLPIDYIEKRNAIVDAVTLDDAKKAARRLWGQGLLTVIVGRAPQAPPSRRQRPRPRRTKAGRGKTNGRQTRYPVSPDSIGECRASGEPMLRISRDLSIDENDIDISFVRASGPGGQNVNKLSTAAQLRFDTRRITLPEDAALRLNRLAGQRMTKDGVIVIHAQRFRTQERNRADAIDRLLEILREAMVRPSRAAPPSRRSDRNSAGSKARSAAATSSPSAARAVRRLR